MKKKILLLSVLFLLFLIPGCVQADEAEDISSSTIIMYNNQATKKLNDGKTSTKIDIVPDKEIKISSEKGIGSIYIKYENACKPGTLIYGNKQFDLGKQGFLHEYVEFSNSDEVIKEATLKFNEKVQISEIYCFTKGDVPSWVQKWKIQTGNVDLILFSTHSDDEQLFFAGLLPTYVDKGLNVQVIYVTNHNDNPTRLHEQLDGLWNVGITNYPVIGQFPDAYSESLKGAVSNLKTAGYTEDDVIKFQVEQIREFKPLVIVGHDENGEYKHGQHILNCDALKQAIVKSNDEEYDKETASKYGIWQTPKLYLHLYSQNQITMNYDVPLNHFNGKTAYEVSKIGYSFHISQQYTWFTKWLKGPNNSYTSATQIDKYNPTKFGLFYTSVGEDVQKNDMFENIDKDKFRPKENIEEVNEQKKDNDIKKSISSKDIVIICVIICVIIVGIIVFNKKSIAKKR